MPSFKGMRFPIDVILVCIRWYTAYPLSCRHLEEMMEERVVSVDRSTINRWAIRFLPLIEKLSRKHKRAVGRSWRMDETYIKVKGVWKYRYRAVDKEGRTVDCLLTAHRDMAASRRLFNKAVRENDAPDKIAMDKSGGNKAAIDEINGGVAVPITVRQVKYLNNIAEQDHRAIKRVTRAMLGGFVAQTRASGSTLPGLGLDDPEVSIDTNHLERALRVIPMGKKNWLFSWTGLGARHVSIVQSLLATCRLHDINPYDYFVDVLQRVGQHPASLVHQLTPRIWKEMFAENPLRSDLHDLGDRRTRAAA